MHGHRVTHVTRWQCSLLIREITEIRIKKGKEKFNKARSKQLTLW